MKQIMSVLWSLTVIRAAVKLSLFQYNVLSCSIPQKQLTIFRGL